MSRRARKRSEAIEAKRYTTGPDEHDSDSEGGDPDAGLCHCDFRTRLVGDGCEHCNPDLMRAYNEVRQS